MKTSFEMFIFVCFSLCGYCQGGADINYIKEAYINEKYINQEVKIDFASTRPFGSFTYTIGDTIEFFMLQDLVQLIEIRKRGVDYWYFDEQYLEGKQTREPIRFRIDRSTILTITPDSIQFRLYINFNSKDAPDQSNKKEKTVEDVWIVRKRLDGIMIQAQ